MFPTISVHVFSNEGGSCVIGNHPAISDSLLFPISLLNSEVAAPTEICVELVPALTLVNDQAKFAHLSDLVVNSLARASIQIGDLVLRLVNTATDAPENVYCAAISGQWLVVFIHHWCCQSLHTITHHEEDHPFVYATSISSDELEYFPRPIENVGPAIGKHHPRCGGLRV